MNGLLAHEWISPTGGSEKVFDRMAAQFPEAAIVCLWNDDVNRYPDRIVHETWLGRTPLRRNKALALPAMTAAWRNLPLGRYDWALISSHAFAHHLSVKNQDEHFKKYVYVHTPARYLWAPELDPRGSSGLVKSVAPLFRFIDRRRATEAAGLAANSEFIRTRIQQCWDRDARVIYPPVNVAEIQSVADWRERLTPSECSLIESLPATFILGASRFVSYKRLDVVIETGEAANVPVVIAGAGPEEPALRARARSANVRVIIVKQPSDALLYALYQAAIVFVFPSVEDFGIMPVEAMACGTPVMVNEIGGSRESLNVPVGGAIIESFDRVGLARAFEKAVSADRRLVAQNVRAFSTRHFDHAISDWMHAEVGAIGVVDEPGCQQ